MGKVKALPAPLEEDEQAVFVQWAELSLLPDAVLHHSPNEGKRGWKAQQALKSNGVRAGWPDIQILHRGRSVFIELKRRKGSKPPSEAQLACHRDLIRAGAVVFLAKGAQEAIDFTRAAGLTKATARHTP